MNNQLKLKPNPAMETQNTKAKNFTKRVKSSKYRGRGGGLTPIEIMIIIAIILMLIGIFFNWSGGYTREINGHTYRSIGYSTVHDPDCPCGKGGD